VATAVIWAFAYALGWARHQSQKVRGYVTVAGWSVNASAAPIRVLQKSVATRRNERWALDAIHIDWE